MTVCSLLSGSTRLQAIRLTSTRLKRTISRTSRLRNSQQLRSTHGVSAGTILLRALHSSTLRYQRIRSGSTTVPVISNTGWVRTRRSSRASLQRDFHGSSSGDASVTQQLQLSLQSLVLILFSRARITRASSINGAIPR